MTLLLPHPTAFDDFAWGEYAWVTGTEGPAGLSEEPVGWDYDVPLRITISVRWDPASLAWVTPSALSLVLTVDCAATAMRWVSTVPLDAESTQRSSAVDVPAHGVSRAITARAWIVAHESVESAGLEAGAKVAWAPPRTLHLEGAVDRFPVETFPFSVRGLPRRAAWRVRLELDDLDEAFGTAVRLQVNSDHPVSGMLLDQHHELAPHLTHVVRRDIINAAIRHLADRDDLDPGGFDRTLPDSFGTVVSGWCQLYLNQSLPSTVGRMRFDPLALDASLQDGMGLLWTVA